MLRRFILACCFVLVSRQALADTLPVETFYNPTVAQNPAWQAIGYANTLAALSSLTAQAKTTKAPPSQRGIRPTINKLVAVYSGKAKGQARRKFAELYIGYALVERRFGIPKNDLAGALTVYIGVNYLAYRGTNLPESEQQAFFLSLYSQTRQVLLASPGFAKMKPVKKRALFEQLAILGTFTAATGIELQGQPNPDIATVLALQDASKRNLEALFNVSIDRIMVTANGLVIQ